MRCLGRLVIAILPGAIAIAIGGCGEEASDATGPTAGASTSSPSPSRCTSTRKGISAADSRRWKDDRDPKENELAERQLVADRLIECRSLVGATRERVQSLLGEPVRTDSAPDEWVYVTGAERSDVQLDSEYLIVEFGAADRVTGLRLSSP